MLHTGPKTSDGWSVTKREQELVSEALGRLRDDDNRSRDDALELLRRALNLTKDFWPKEKKGRRK